MIIKLGCVEMSCGKNQGGSGKIIFASGIFSIQSTYHFKTVQNISGYT